MKKFIYFLDNIEKYAIYLMFTLLVSLMFIQVVARYVFAQGWGWMETLTRVLFVYITYIGASWAAKGAQHLRVSAAAVLIPGKYTKNVILLIGDLFLICIAGYFCWSIATMCYSFFLKGTTYPGAEWLRSWVLYFAGVLGFFGITIRTIQGGVIPTVKEIVSLSRSSDTASGQSER